MASREDNMAYLIISEGTKNRTHGTGACIQDVPLDIRDTETRFIPVVDAEEEGS